MVTAVRGRAGLARACAGALAAVALVTVWLALQIGGRQASLWVDDVSTPAAAALALWLCLRARGRAAADTRRFWTLLSGAMACWTLAELIWGVYPLLLHRDVPSVSVADAGYLLAIPLALGALRVHPAIDATGGEDPLGRRRGARERCSTRSSSRPRCSS